MFFFMECLVCEGRCNVNIVWNRLCWIRLCRIWGIMSCCCWLRWCVMVLFMGLRCGFCMFWCKYFWILVVREYGKKDVDWIFCVGWFFFFDLECMLIGFFCCWMIWVCIWWKKVDIYFFYDGSFWYKVEFVLRVMRYYVSNLVWFVMIYKLFILVLKYYGLILGKEGLWVFEDWEKWEYKVFDRLFFLYRFLW